MTQKEGEERVTRKKIRSPHANASVDTSSGLSPMDAGRLPFGQSPTGREFNPDYTYVIKDLRRIVLLAGSLIVILLGLSFFLQ